MRARARAAAAALAGITLLGLAGCVGGGGDDGPVGPNGYELGATFDDIEVWHDVGESSGINDVVLTQEGVTQPIGVCIGEAGTFCRLGDWSVLPVVVLVAPEGARAELDWNGETVEMTMLDRLSDEGPVVYVADPPPIEPGSDLSTSYRVLDESGEVVFEQ